MKKAVRRAVDFLTHDMWRIRAGELSRGRLFLLNQLRVFVLAIRGFKTDRCSLRASALTFYSILSIVPVVALAFGIAKGFQLEKHLETRLYAALEGHREVAENIVGFANRLLENTKGGLMAGIGVLILLWTVIKVLGNIEKAFNHVWGVQRNRTLIRRFTDYISFMLICPVLLVLSSSITVVVSREVKAVIQQVEFLGFLGPVIYALFSVTPFFIGWLLFGLLYTVMPNTRVKLRSGLIAGVVAGTIFQLVQWGYVNSQIGMTKYNAVYGSFAALPMFLIWLQVSWLVVLFGAELSFAHQNVDTYEFEPDCERASRRFRRLLELRMAGLVVKNFGAGQKPLTAEEITGETGAPIRLVRQGLFELVNAGLLSEVRQDAESDPAYQPARPIDTMTAGSVLELLDHSGSEDIPVTRDAEWKQLAECLDSFAKAVKSSDANVALKDL
jgi:membrane protein